MLSMGETSTVTPAFLTKLWALVEDTSTDHLICWDMSGKSFHVYDQLQFAREVLPMYFKHGNIASFIRQLNMYGFRKVVQIDHGGLKTEKDDMEFQHPYFIRGKENLISQIKRKPPAAGLKESDSRVQKDDVNKVLTDMQLMKNKQETMTNKLDSMKRENESLWREVASLRQKHTQQQQIVNKLIQFLVNIMRNKPGMGVNRRRPLMINDSTERDGARPAKLARQYSLESVGGTHYTVDMPQSPEEILAFLEAENESTVYTDCPDTPSTPLSSSMGRQGGVVIHEMSDNGGDYNPIVDISEIDVGNAEVIAPTQVDSPQITEVPAQTLEQFIQSASAAQQPIKTQGKQIKKIQLPPGYTVVTSKGAPGKVIGRVVNTGGSGDVKPIVTEMKPLVTGNVQMVTGKQMPLATGKTQHVPTKDIKPVITQVSSMLPSAPVQSTSNIKPVFTGVEFPDTAQAQMTTTGQAIQSFVTEPSSSLAVITDSPSSSLNLSDPARLAGMRALPSPHRTEVNDLVENIDLDLDALKDLLAAGQYSLDAGTLMGLFTPEGPVPQTPDHLLNFGENEHPLSGIVASNSKQEEGANNVVGNELIQYQSPEDFMFSLDNSNDLPLDTNQSIFPELESLNTPNLLLSPEPPSYIRVKQESRPMEEVD